MVKKLLYNIFPVLNQRGKFKPHIMGIFPQALQRTMTPVCLDNNVTINLQGRTLVVRAVKEVHYTGMKDLRQNEETRTSYVVKLKQRRRDFQIFYGYQCHCGKCTTEYEADINPLKCGTTGCPARIPSDARALQPCPLCGADNAAQLHKMHAAVRTQDRDKNKDRDNGIKETMKILTQVGELDTIVHPDAHIRFACGKDAVSYLQLLGCYEAAWELAQGMVDCVRALCPEYHVGRACFLVKAATIPYLWKRDISEQEQQRLATVFREALPKALGWMREAVSIYRKLNGEDSVWAQAVVDFMRIHAPADVSATESAALTPPARKANWDWGNQKAVVL
ncbi:uncharacterized protein LOC129584076 [Paramacrobiotus metropolitanus]|uniref:uncharacterized protein LOC129584076 n=1 Tax=Paramacrobiotus metropolitanus TaxID=2943436 RepID=UPI002445EAD2|nr:uncharacterized protein LOC129584076 [Paramacrobiotus metropolitanus]